MHFSAYEVCLERVAEELMGRRKWKHCQEQLTRTQLQAIDQLSIQNIAEEKSNKVEKEEELRSNNNNIVAENFKKEILAKQESKLYEQNHQSQTQLENSKQIAKEVHISEPQVEENGLKIEDKNTSPTLNNNITTASYINSTSSIDFLPSSPPTSPTNSRPNTPIDWKPNDKCYFCVDGKLLTVNAKGELVAEKGPALTESTDHIHRLDSDSDSNESITLKHKSTSGSLATDNNHLTLNKLLTSQIRDFPANMTSMDSMAARLAAIQSISQQICPNINWLQLAQQQQQQQQNTNSLTSATSDTLAAALSPTTTLKDSPSPSATNIGGPGGGGGGEQPLDLSSKPSPNSSISGDLKSVRSKSERSTPIPANSAGRRTYSNEDLNQAVHDIKQGKLGTRKAAEQYNVPRSTLRNKVHKLSLESKQTVNDMEGEKELLLPDDDSDTDINASPSPSAIATLSELRNRMAVSNGVVGTDADSETDGDGISIKRQSPFSTTASQPQASPQPNAAAALLDPNILMKTLELFGSLIGINIKDAIAAAAANNEATESLNNSGLINGKPMLEQRLLLQHLLQQHQNQQQQQTSVSPFGQNRLSKCDTPETASSLDANDTSCEDVASAILKIPSYKPVAGAANSNNRSSVSPQSNAHLSRNGDSPHSVASPRLMISASAVNRQSHNSLPIISPPLLHQPSLRETFNASIHRLMNEQANNNGGLASLDGKRNSTVDGKKPSISVVKNIGGTDTSHFGSAPNLLVGHNSHHSHHSHVTAPMHHSHMHPSQASLSPHHHHHHHLSRQDQAALAAGKGTRPKRGKYRNYDRDSLVEAVKAVQRGEMSVHRAGSYYGVPHSTLEYKVKERHLMRPRKREPKPQPGLDGASKSSANIPGGSKGSSSTANSKISLASYHKNNNGSAAFPATSAAAANGMKMSLFDPSAAYTGHLLWPHAPTALGQLQMNFNRNAASQPPGAALDELYESSAANGSAFFEGIIRKTLGKSETSSSTGPLLDQLLIDKNPMPFTNHRINDFGTAASSAAVSAISSAGKRSANSPLNYGEIKRERNSPLHSSDDEEEAASASGAEETVEHNNNNKCNLNRATGLGMDDHLNLRRHSRLTSHDGDSETDASSLKSDRLPSHHYQHNNNKEVCNLNGGDSIEAETSKPVQVKTEVSTLCETTTSILHEKLAQIKAEQENCENL